MEVRECNLKRYHPRISQKVLFKAFAWVKFAKRIQHRDHFGTFLDSFHSHAKIVEVGAESHVDIGHQLEIILVGRIHLKIFRDLKGLEAKLIRFEKVSLPLSHIRQVHIESKCHLDPGLNIDIGGVLICEEGLKAGNGFLEHFGGTQEGKTGLPHDHLVTAVPESLGLFDEPLGGY